MLENLRIFLYIYCFGVLSISHALTFKGDLLKKYIYTFDFVFVYACLDEIHQKFIPGRSGQFTDVLIDCCGAFVGVMCIYIISRLYIKNKEKKSKILVSNNIENSKKRKVVFIASTGGHLNELLQLKDIFDKFDYSIITEKNEVDLSLKDEYGEKVKFLIYGTRKEKLKYIVKFLINSFISLVYYFKLQPEVIVTTGTHTAVPICYIGKIFGSKIIFIETFANRTTGTLAGKLVYPIADKFVVQWEEMHEIYPKSVCWGWIY